MLVRNLSTIQNSVHNDHDKMTNSHLLEISLFPDMFQRYKFSQTQSEIP